MDEPKDMQEKPSWLDTAKTHAVPIAAAGLAVVAIPAGLSALGFTAAGVGAGSVAAKMMSALGTSGWLVPTLQSAGAAGTALTTKALVGGSAFFATCQWNSKKDNNDSKL